MKSTNNIYLSKWCHTICIDILIGSKVIRVSNSQYSKNTVELLSKKNIDIYFQKDLNMSASISQMYLEIFY
jgi:hypothetical protein